MATTLNAANDVSRHIRTAVEKVERAGYPVPERLTTVVEHVNLIRTVGDAPVPPTVGEKDFGKKLDVFLREHAAYQAQGTARLEALSAANRELSRTSVEACDEVLQSIRGDFESAAGDYVTARRVVAGCDTLEDAARADLTGEAVAAWHARTAAGKRMNALIDVVKGLLFPLVASSGGSFVTETVLCMIADTRDAYVIARTVRERSEHLPHDVRRFEALCEAGATLKLMESVDDLRDRVMRMRDDNE